MVHVLGDYSADKLGNDRCIPPTADALYIRPILSYFHIVKTFVDSVGNRS